MVPQPRAYRSLVGPYSGLSTLRLRDGRNPKVDKKVGL